MTKAMEIAIMAYMKMFSSGCRKRFFLSHSSTSDSDSISPAKLITNIFILEKARSIKTERTTGLYSTNIYHSSSRSRKETFLPLYNIDISLLSVFPAFIIISLIKENSVLCISKTIQSAH